MRLLLLLLLLAVSLPIHAAESDPYWGWRQPPKDVTVVLDRILNRKFTRGLAALNKTQVTTCREAAHVLTAPLKVTSDHFFRSEMRQWPMDRSPRSYDDRAEFDAVSVYRHAPLLPFGSLVPLDPTLQVDGVLIGPDKIGHFFTNGLRAWEVYVSAKANGADEAAAWDAAMRYGVAEENGWLGKGIDGVFSYADLSAAAAGVRFYARLCDDDDPLLVRGADGRWFLRAPFSIEDHVDPCWDESFEANAYADSEDAAVVAAVADVCPLLDDAVVRQRRAAYRARGCDARTQQSFAALIAAGEAPDPKRWDVDTVCHAQKAERLAP